MKRTAFSLFIDDTHHQPPGALGRVVDFCEAQGVRGKFSAIPGYYVLRDEDTLGQADKPWIHRYVGEMARVTGRGFDVHMELMTHNCLWDFEAGVQREEGDGPHEIVWLHEPGVPVAEYEAYFGAIMDNVKARGIEFHGITVPGCPCEVCTSRLAELKAQGHNTLSDNLWQALLNMSEQGRFGVPVAAAFIDRVKDGLPTRMMLERDGFGAYDSRIDVDFEDHIAAGGDAVDYYITRDGKGGVIPELVDAGADQCFMLGHWFLICPGKNPEQWANIEEILRRINRRLGDRIEWVRPSEYGRRLLAG